MADMKKYQVMMARDFALAKEQDKKPMHTTVTFFDHNSKEVYGTISFVTSQEIFVESHGDIWASIDTEDVGGAE